MIVLFFSDVVPPFSPNLHKKPPALVQLLPMFGSQTDHGEVLVVGTLILIMLALCISAAAHLRETERKEAAEREGPPMHRKKFNLGYL